MKKIKGLSLFANVGVAEARLNELDDIEILIANEIDEKRAKMYQHIYPNTEMITGDITNSDIFNDVILKSKKAGVNFIIATPPCQGMSTAGKMDPKDERNQLIFYAIKAIKELMPDYVLIENVPQQLKTKIHYNNKDILIPEYIHACLDDDYSIYNQVVESSNFGVAQIRQRSIFLMVKKTIDIDWDFSNLPLTERPKTLEDVIGHLPSIDPKIQGYSEKELLDYFPEYYIKKEQGLKVSKWHRPPVHKIRHVEIMRYTPEGMSAMKNEIHYPKKPNGERIKGYANTYKRQLWNRPAYTVTTYNGAICSHDNVHPGHYIGKDNNGDDIYSDPRVLTIYELMRVMSIPDDWNIPEWANESLIRHSIGEGIPPLVIKILIENLLNKIT